MSRSLVVSPGGVAAAVVLAALLTGCPSTSNRAKGTASGGLECNGRLDIQTCTNGPGGPASQIALGALSAPDCRTGCESALRGAAAGSGCWILATGTCYCRTGTVTSTSIGGSMGGTCATVPPLKCSRLNNVACTQGTTPEIDLGVIGATECHDRCEGALAAAGLGSGCFVIAMNGTCYCRSGGVIAGTGTGGECTDGSPLTCSTQANVACANGATVALNFGAISPAECRTQCQVWMPGHGVIDGCWEIAAGDGNCYCRSGALTAGTEIVGSCT